MELTAVRRWHLRAEQLMVGRQVRLRPSFTSSQKPAVSGVSPDHSLSLRLFKFWFYRFYWFPPHWLENVASFPADIRARVSYLWSGTGDAEDGRSPPAEGGKNHRARVRSWSYPPRSAGRRGAESAQRHGWMRRAGTDGLSSTAGSARIGPRAVTSQRRSSASLLARDRLCQDARAQRGRQASGENFKIKLCFCLVIFIICCDFLTTSTELNTLHVYTLRGFQWKSNLHLKNIFVCLSNIYITPILQWMLFLVNKNVFFQVYPIFKL